MSWVEEAAGWAAGLAVADVPERVLERARLQRAATLAAAHAAASDPAVAAVRDAVATWSREGPAEVVGADLSLEPAGAVYANAAAGIAHDWDDYLYAGHTGHSSVWASLGAAAEWDRSAADALVAQVAANEVAGRLGAALLLGPHNGQFWSSIHCASGALAAGMLAGLGPERLAHALGTALYQPPYGLWPGFMGPDTKLLTAAEGAAQGVRAVRLAQRGLSGPLDVVEDRRGLLANLSFAPRPSMLGGLGQVWLTDTLAFKPRPGCAYLQTAIEATVRLRREHGFGPADVEAVEVEAGWLTCGMERLSAGPGLTPVRVTFSVGLSVAVALEAGELTHAELERDWLAAHEPELRSLAARVRLRHDWDLTLATVRGVAEALPISAQVGDVTLARWAAIPRRMRELGMDELGLGLRDLVALAARPDVRRAVAGGLPARRKRCDERRGLAALDTERLRMPFPNRVTIRLRSGGSVTTEGAERGSAGAPLSDQQAVVAEKEKLVGASRAPA